MFAAGLALCAGCGGVAEKAPPVAAAPKAGEQPVETEHAPVEAGWGDVVGRIVWEGKLPVAGVIDLANHADKAACEKDGVVKNETWSIDPKTKGLKNTFVWLEPPQKGQAIAVHPSLVKIAPATVEVDQPACAFIPHAVALREGQVLVAKNTSALPHNFKWGGSPVANPGGNQLIAPAMNLPIGNLKADRLPIAVECNIHPWMKGWIRVFDHPYFAVTDDRGRFEFKNAPAGEFKLKIWNGSGGWAGGAAGKDGRPLTIQSGVNSLGDLAYPAPLAAAPKPNDQSSSCRFSCVEESFDESLWIFSQAGSLSGLCGPDAGRLLRRRREETGLEAGRGEEGKGEKGRQT